LPGCGEQHHEPPRRLQQPSRGMYPHHGQHLWYQPAVGAGTVSTTATL